MTTEQQHNDETTHFGFKTIRAEDKVGMVRNVFDSVASKYDLMNDLMSGGVHRLWKAALMDRLDPRPGMALLDVAGGTGDIAFRFQDRVAKRGAVGKVVVCDINESMLSVGRDRALDQGRMQGLDWVVGNAEDLPFPDRSFDCYTIAFGLRNVTHTDKALAEARRVLKPGGRFMCLEFSRVVMPVLKEMYDQYSFKIMPWMGQIVANDRESYQYLAESIRQFPPQDELVQRMEAVGLAKANYVNLSGGIAAIHSGWRI